MKKRIIASGLLLTLIIGMTSCSEAVERETDASNKEAISEFSLTVNSESNIGMEFTVDDYPIIGNTEYTLTYNRELFEALLCAEDGNEISSHVNYPRETYSRNELENKVKSGEMDMAFIEMTKDEKSFDEELDYTLIGIFPLVFITSYENPVESISSSVLDDMLYEEKINSWSDLGGPAGEIKYVYNTESSNYFETLNRVLSKGEKELNFNLIDKYEDSSLSKDIPFIIELQTRFDDGSYYLTVYNPFRMYFYFSIGDEYAYVKPVYIDGIKPTYDSVKNGEYPYTLYTYAVTRKGEKDKGVTALLDWINKEDAEESLSSSRIKSSIGYINILNILSCESAKQIMENMVYRCEAESYEHAVMPNEWDRLPQEEWNKRKELTLENYQEWISLLK